MRTGREEAFLDKVSRGMIDPIPSFGTRLSMICSHQAERGPFIHSVPQNWPRRPQLRNVAGFK